MFRLRMGVLVKQFYTLNRERLNPARRLLPAAHALAPAKHIEELLQTVNARKLPTPRASERALPWGRRLLTNALTPVLERKSMSPIPWVADPFFR